MDYTFIAFLNLTPDATVLFSSDSVSEILGYEPEEVCNRSSFEFLHPQEVEAARRIYARSVSLDKAASLYYIRLLSKDGRWITCECCFTIVHDVVVACISVYHQGEKSRRRAADGAQIRRIFSASPRDPRYHMLEHLSPRFSRPPVEHEPRAALILNRFSMNLSVMFATSAVSSILGSEPEEMRNRSFYRYMQERCLSPALKVLESAKANDSIAYLRFWSRDPREDWDYNYGNDDGKDDWVSDSDGGGVELDGRMDVDDDDDSPHRSNSGDSMLDAGPSVLASPRDKSIKTEYSDSPSGVRLPASPETSNSSVTARPPRVNGSAASYRRRPLRQSVEIEAVVSCASDGLVVVLRRARPLMPLVQAPAPAIAFDNGLYAAPWGQQPIQPYVPRNKIYVDQTPVGLQQPPMRPEIAAAGGPPMDVLMSAIRDTAVFAWALCGINGNIAELGKGKPKDGAQPHGLPIWDPNAGKTPYQPPDNPASLRYERENKGKANRLRPAPNPYPFPVYQASSSRTYEDFTDPREVDLAEERVVEDRSYGAHAEWPLHQRPISNGHVNGNSHGNGASSLRHPSMSTMYKEQPQLEGPNNFADTTPYGQAQFGSQHAPPTHVNGPLRPPLYNTLSETPTPDASLLPGGWPALTPLGEYQQPMVDGVDGNHS